MEEYQNYSSIISVTFSKALILLKSSFFLKPFLAYCPTILIISLLDSISSFLGLLICFISTLKSLNIFSICAKTSFEFLDIFICSSKILKWSNLSEIL